MKHHAESAEFAELVLDNRHAESAEFAEWRTKHERHQWNHARHP